MAPPPRLDSGVAAFLWPPPVGRIPLARRFQIHLITDRKSTRGDLLGAVGSALMGGVDWVQVREKSGSARELYETARAIIPLARRCGTEVTINDRIDVALAIGAGGVHLAAKSLPPRAVRDLLGDHRILGASVHGPEEAREAVEGGVDYVTFGHVYPTSSKPGLPPRGVLELAEVVNRWTYRYSPSAGSTLPTFAKCSAPAVPGSRLSRPSSLPRIPDTRHARSAGR